MMSSILKSVAVGGLFGGIFAGVKSAFTGNVQLNPELSEYTSLVHYDEILIQIERLHKFIQFHPKLFKKIAKLSNKFCALFHLVMNNAKMKITLAHIRVANKMVIDCEQHLAEFFKHIPTIAQDDFREVSDNLKSSLKNGLENISRQIEMILTGNQ
jgi:hypothetical protein